MSPESPVVTEYRPAYLRLLYILVLGSLLVYILKAGAALLMPIAVAAFFAMLLAPMAGWLEAKRIGRFAGAIIPILCLLLFFALLTSMAVRQITSIAGSLEGAADRVGTMSQRVNYFLSWHLDLDEPVLGGIDGKGVLEFVKNSSGYMLTWMGSLTGSIFGIFIVPALTFFILYYRNHLFEFSVRFLKRASRDEVGKRVEDARLVAQKYFVGMMKVVAILAVLNSIALFLIGVEHAIFFGVFAAFLNVVPFVGPLVGSILPILYVFVTRDSLFYPVAVAVAFIVIQFLESNLFTPRIIGSNVRVNPLVVFIGLLAGAMVWGVVGMIIIIPVLSISMQLFRLDPRSEPFAYLFGIPPQKGVRLWQWRGR